jgi:transcriptional regulator with XRE-family HTH domain
MATQAVSHQQERFAGLLLQLRGRTGLTQRDLAARLGASRRSVQDWESGVYYPNAHNLKSLIAVLLEAGGLTPGQETAEAEALWAAALRESERMQTPFDVTWFAELLGKRGR